MKKTWLIASLLLMIPGVALAEDKPVSYSMITLIVDNAGIAGWTTFAVSIIAFTLVIKLVMDTRREKVLPAAVEQHVADLISEQDYEGAVNSVSGDLSFLGRVLYGGLSKMNGGKDAVQKGLDDSWNTQYTTYMQVASYVQFAAQISPMLGLFGTVSGMMDAFAVLAQSSGAANPKDLATGIMYALVTTFIGLLVAMPCSAAYLFIRNKIISSSLEVGTRANDILDNLFNTEEE